MINNRELQLKNESHNSWLGISDVLALASETCNREESDLLESTQVISKVFMCLVMH